MSRSNDATKILVKKVIGYVCTVVLLLVSGEPLRDAAVTVLSGASRVIS